MCPAAPVIVTPVAMSEVKAAKTLNVRGSASKSCSNARPPLAASRGRQRCGRRRPPPPLRRLALDDAAGARNARATWPPRERQKSKLKSAARAQTQNHAGLRQRLRAQRRGPGLRAELRAAARAARRAELAREEPADLRAVVAQINRDGQRIQALFADRDRSASRRPSPRRRRGGYDPPIRVCRSIALTTYSNSNPTAAPARKRSRGSSAYLEATDTRDPVLVVVLPAPASGLETLRKRDATLPSPDSRRTARDSSLRDRTALGRSHSSTGQLRDRRRSDRRNGLPRSTSSPTGRRRATTTATLLSPKRPIRY